MSKNVINDSKIQSEITLINKSEVAPSAFNAAFNAWSG